MVLALFAAALFFVLGLFGAIETEAAQPIERKTYQLAEVALMLGCSRNHAYAMARENVFPVVRLGPRRIVVPRDRFDAWLNGEQR